MFTERFLKTLATLVRAQLSLSNSVFDALSTDSVRRGLRHGVKIFSVGSTGQKVNSERSVTLSKSKTVRSLGSGHYIPCLRLNLMLTDVLDKRGYHHHGGDQKWRLTKGSLVVAKGNLCCTLYKTYGKIIKGVECCGRFSKSMAQEVRPHE